MAEIKAFQGIRYNQSKIKNLDGVVAPPYDIIDESQQDGYYRRHPQNIIRLELGKTKDGDDCKNNQYTRARDYYQDWRGQGFLTREEVPAIYLYEQEFLDGKEPNIRKGVICAVKLEDYDKNIVIPHEETLPKAKEDRLNLMRSCHANFSPTFGIYMDEENEVGDIFKKAKKNPPEMDFADEDGIKHRVWVLKDEKQIQKFQSLLAERQIFIADGHHRYETALNFSKEMEGQKGYGHAMMTLVNVYDTGLVVYPTHRLVKNIEDFNPQKIHEGLKKNFEVQEVEIGANGMEGIIDELSKDMDEKHRFAMSFDGKKFYFINAARGSINIDDSRCEAWNSLDIAVLQEMILDRLLGIGQKERAEGGYLEYTRDEMEGFDKLRGGGYQALFLVNTTKVEEVVDVALAGDKMPQKSTYFYPKLITGLVINPLGE
ncbi:MAG: DUF1015 domain-containing protein [Clostridia bacterium]|nr:DUF1015 domain-containing protein [Clostridia bacterium]